MDWLLTNLAETIVIIGLVLLAIEILVLGFSTFVLFFIGIAAVATGGLLFTGIIAETPLNAVLTLAVLTLLAAASLWQPLKRMQEDSQPEAVTSDLIGYSFILEQDITPSQYGEHKYSGITWKVKSKQPIESGSQVTVVKADVGVFEVELST